MRALFLLFLLLLVIGGPADAQAQGAGAVRAIVCPAGYQDIAPPAFDAPDCEAVALTRLDPQGRLVWARIILPVGATVDPAAPLAVFVSAKASSEVWLDGVLIGANGAPAATAAGEIPGRMDAVFPIPAGALAAGQVTLDLRMSSHRGLLRLSQPVHIVALGPYQPPRLGFLDYYWPSLATLGALLAGAVYFAAAVFGAEGRRDSALLAGMFLLAAAQLFAEAARGLLAYPYPAHDLRLIAIFLLSFGFGVCLAAYIVLRFEDRRPRLTLGVIAALSVSLSLAVPGFDWKTMAAILVPTVACAALTARRMAQRRAAAARYFAALAGFALIIVLGPTLFLDMLFYYAVAGLLLFLFMQQALTLAEEQRLRRREAERASRLELVLEQRQARPDAAIAVASAGRTDRVPITDIAYIRGAGDYVELCLLDGREILHAASLNALEDTLPPTFLRVHRSHIVNTAYVRALEREPTGVGRLVLSNGAEAPVSRRILPRVRAALG